MTPRPLPLESDRPLVAFAYGRLIVTLLGLAAMLVLSVPDDRTATAVIAALALPWALAMLFVTRRSPRHGVSSLAAAGDFALLVAIELLAPETYGVVRFAALVLAAGYAHLLGERRGLALGALGTAALVAVTALGGDAPVDGSVLALYEGAFVACTLLGALLAGRLRTAESASRLRARRLARRSLQSESEIRRRVAEAIHDGPVQELIGLDMMLSSAGRATAQGRRRDAARLLDDARAIAERSVNSLRDEIVDLGPYSFEGIGFQGAIERCVDVWRRRYGFDVELDIERVELPPEVTGDLFRIAQEAVVNSGRHANASAVAISLRRVGPTVELQVTDNGRGFNGSEPLGASEPGHIGLAGMRERAGLMQGELSIDSSERGTHVLVTVPAPQPGGSGS